MRKNIKTIVLISCLFLMFIKVVGAQVMIQNSIARIAATASSEKFTSTYKSVKKCIHEDGASSLKLNLSSHVTGDINKNKIAVIVGEIALSAVIPFTPSTYQKIVPAAIFIPPRSA